MVGTGSVLAPGLGGTVAALVPGMDVTSLVLLAVMIVFYLGIPVGLLLLVFRSGESSTEPDSGTDGNGGPV